MVNTSRYASIKNVYKRDHGDGKIRYGEFSIPEFEYLQACKWTFTEKMNGMNIRVILDADIDFRGRSDAAHMPGPLLQHLQQTFDVESVREESRIYGEGLCLYGEGIGAGIPQSANYGPNQFFTLFDVMTDYGWASRQDVVDIAAHLHIPVVPVVFEGTLDHAVGLVRSGIKSVYGDFFAEGLIGRPESGLRDQYGNRITCKIKHRDFYQRGTTWLSATKKPGRGMAVSGIPRALQGLT
jgi:hypothetical protein